VADVLRHVRVLAQEQDVFDAEAEEDRQPCDSDARLDTCEECHDRVDGEDRDDAVSDRAPFPWRGEQPIESG
jgi:hypothetical protein